MIKQALRLYGRTILAGVMGGFIYLSVGILFTVAFPRGEGLSGAASFLMNFVALFLQGGTFLLLIYAGLWSLGDKESNAVQFGHLQATATRGFKIGWLAAMPSMLSFVLLVADKMFSLWEHCVAAYRVCHLALYPLIVWSLGPNAATTTAELSWWRIVCAGIPVLILPLAAGGSYYLGFKQIVVSNRLMFVNKKK